MGKTIAYVISVITIIGFLAGFSVFGEIKKGQEVTEKQIVEIKEKSDDLKEEIDENENMNLQQMIILERVVKSLDKLEAKL